MRSLGGFAWLPIDKKASSFYKTTRFKLWGVGPALPTFIHLHSCGFTIATFQAAYVFSCSMIINSSPLGPPVTVGPPLLAWYVSVLLSGRGIWCLESLVGFGPASNPVQGPFTLLLTGLPLFAYAFSSACLWLHYPFSHYSPSSSIVDDFKCS